MRRAIAATALLAIGLAAQAQDIASPQFKEGEERFGQPGRIVAPEYPPQALQERRGGVVEVSGRVSPIGVLEDAKVSAVPPTDEAFAKAVREVLEYWLFYVPTGSDCQPDRRPVLNRVEFSAEDGKPHIGVVRLASPRADTPTDKYKPLRRIEPRYPDRAVREGVESTVYARIDVDAEGKPKVTAARAYWIRDSGALRTMENETRSALESWRFPPPADGKPWSGCYTLNFRLHG